MDTELVRYDAMCHAIAAAYEVDEVKEIRDRSIALAAYARQIANLEAESRCAKIRLRAERRAAEIYDQQVKATGRGERQADGTYGQRSDEATSGEATLADHGITKQQMSAWRKLAALPEEDFEAELTRQYLPNAASVIHALDPPEAPKGVPVDANALWFACRLVEFRDRGLLNTSPDDVLATMTTGMLADVHELGPALASWLQAIEEAMDEAFGGGGPVTRRGPQDHRVAAYGAADQPFLGRQRGDG